MSLAAERDALARQYASGFRDVFAIGMPALQSGLSEAGSLEGAIVTCHLRLFSALPASLIARKRGPEVAQEASRRARQVLERGWPHAEASHQTVAEFDAWLRADGHARNPGTTADLVTACLFVALREGIITLPPKLPWSAGGLLHKMVRSEQ